MSTVKEQLPAFHYFQVGNGYTGNIGENKYKLISDKGEQKMTAFVYCCPQCFELAKAQDKIRDTGEFELTPEGFEACKDWLEEKMQ